MFKIYLLLTEFTTKHAMYVKLNIEGCSSNNCCSGKPTRIIHCQCPSEALRIQHADRISQRSNVLSCVACPTLRYSSALFDKRRDFLKKIMEKNVSIFSTNVSETVLDTKKLLYYIILHVIYPPFR